jgi:putative transposase
MEPRARRRWRASAWGRTPRIGEKNGRKRSLLVDGRGIPLSLVGSGANRHDSHLLRPTLQAIVYPRPGPQSGSVQTLCADAAYVGFPALAASRLYHYELNVKTRSQEREEKRHDPGHKARRWVVERTHSWLNCFRKLLVSFEKTEASYLGLLALAAALVCWRQTVFICG